MAKYYFFEHLKYQKESGVSKIPRGNTNFVHLFQRSYVFLMLHFKIYFHFDKIHIYMKNLTFPT